MDSEKIWLRGLGMFALVLLLLLAPGLASAQEDGIQEDGSSHLVQSGDTLGEIALQHGISTEALAHYNSIADPSVIHVGQRLAIPAGQPAPAAPVAEGKVILIDLSQQHLYAYEDGSPVLDTFITTGRPELSTPTGQYEVLVKYSPYQFISPWPQGHEFYYEPAWADYSLRFTWRGHHIHDAPWRTAYGPGTNTEHQVDGEWRTGSHGCVNIPPSQMPALYEWAEVGTPVVIQE